MVDHQALYDLHASMGYTDDEIKVLFPMTWGALHKDHSADEGSERKIRLRRWRRRRYIMVTCSRCGAQTRVISSSLKNGDTLCEECRKKEQETLQEERDAVLADKAAREKEKSVKRSTTRRLPTVKPEKLVTMEKTMDKMLQEADQSEFLADDQF
jgi:uncharacterized Zn finger protein (UPF0148 family)